MKFNELWNNKSWDHQTKNGWKYFANAWHKFQSFCHISRTIHRRVLNPIIFWECRQSYYIFVFLIFLEDRQLTKWKHWQCWQQCTNLEGAYLTILSALAYSTIEVNIDFLNILVKGSLPLGLTSLSFKLLLLVLLYDIHKWLII